MAKRIFDLPELQRKQKDNEDQLVDLRNLLDQKTNRINQLEKVIDQLNLKVKELVEKVNIQHKEKLDLLDVDVQSLKQCAHEKLGSLQTQVEQLKVQISVKAEESKPEEPTTEN
jgi:uncharacterized coiled-coil DUF342 family protein